MADEKQDRPPDLSQLFFPKSAAPIILRIAVMIVGIIVLCWAVSQWTAEPAQNPATGTSQPVPVQGTLDDRGETEEGGAGWSPGFGQSDAAEETDQERGVVELR